jgi:hypothetical protein
MADKGGSGYEKIDTVSPELKGLIGQLIQQVIPNYQAAAEGFKQFLPGGGGGKAITDAAQKNFQQQTVPDIFNSFGRGSKGSSALNQTLATGASNLNTDIASLMSQYGLQAASGLGGLAQGQLSGASLPTFALAPRQQPFGQQLLGGLLGLGGQLGGAYLGRPGGF